MDVVAVDRADVLKPQFFPQRPWNECARDQILKGLGPGQNHISHRWNRLQDVFDFVLQVVIRPGSTDTVQITREGPDIGRNGHLVIVQQDYHSLLEVSNLVYSLKRHASGQPGVADEGDDVKVFAFQVPSGRDSQRR